MVPPHGDWCLTKDLGPSTFIAITICQPTSNTMQVPCFGTPSGTTDPKATDHGPQSGVTAPNPHAPRATANRPTPP